MRNWRSGENERSGSHLQRSKFKFVQHHGEAGFQRPLDRHEVVHLRVQNEMEHLDKGEKYEEKHSDKPGEVAPDEIEGLDQHCHSVVELENL